MSYDSDIRLTRIGNGKLLFYPSCGTDSRWLSDNNCDVIVMADYSPRTEDSRQQFWQEFSRNMGGEVSLTFSTVRTRVFRIRGKLGFLFFQDNNEVLERIRNSGNKISFFIGVCDGCREGGNYECVNDLKFLDKVMSLIHPDGMTYVTDHSEYLFPIANFYDCPPPEPYQEFILGNKFFRRVYSEWDWFCSDWWASRSRWCTHRVTSGYGPITKYMVSVHQPTVYEWRGEHLRITIEHDSIANNLSELSGAIMSRRCKHLCERIDPTATRSIDIAIASQYYFKPSKLSGWSSGKSLHHLLQMCEQRKWEIVGTTAFGEGEHSEMIGILENWTGQLPKWIRIFHLDSQDFEGLKQQFGNQVETAG
jgi:hypothetical protein